jgi:hypothetical protein
MYKFVGAHIMKEGSEITQEQAKWIMYWFLAAGQVEPGKTGQSSSVKTELGHVLQTGPAFNQWATQKMRGYLGDGPHAATGQQVQVGGAVDHTVQQLTNTVATFGANLVADREAKAKKDTEGKALTETNLAYLMGWCGVATPGEVPAFWPLVRATNDTASHRDNISDGMKAWSEATGHRISENFLFTKEQIEDFVKMNPNPTGLQATSKASDRGVSNLMCLLWTPREIEERILMEQAREESKDNSTFEENWKFATKDLKEPPNNYWLLHQNVCTLAALLFVLYGAQCDLYIAVTELIAILNDRECTTAYRAFTPLYCRKISWAVYVDCRNFFTAKFRPSNFRLNNPKYARSRLRDIHSEVLYQKPIHRSSFPMAWEAKPKPNLAEAGTSLGGGGNNTTTGGGGNHNARQREQGGRSGQGGQGGGGGYGGGGRQGNGNLNPAFTHVCPKIRKMMAGLYEKFDGKLNIQEIMENANMTWDDMPKLAACTNRLSGKCEMCWNHVVGICRWGDGCDWIATHDDGAKLPTEFVDRVVSALQPGVDVMMKDGYRRKRKEAGVGFFGRPVPVPSGTSSYGPGSWRRCQAPKVSRRSGGCNEMRRRHTPIESISRGGGSGGKQGYID